MLCATWRWCAGWAWWAGDWRWRDIGVAMIARARARWRAGDCALGRDDARDCWRCLVWQWRSGACVLGDGCLLRAMAGRGERGARIAMIVVVDDGCLVCLAAVLCVVDAGDVRADGGRCFVRAACVGAGAAVTGRWCVVDGVASAVCDGACCWCCCWWRRRWCVATTGVRDVWRGARGRGATPTRRRRAGGAATWAPGWRRRAPDLGLVPRA